MRKEKGSSKRALIHIMNWNDASKEERLSFWLTQVGYVRPQQLDFSYLFNYNDLSFQTQAYLRKVPKKEWDLAIKAALSEAKQLIQKDLRFAGKNIRVGSNQNSESFE